MRVVDLKKDALSGYELARRIARSSVVLSQPTPEARRAALREVAEPVGLGTGAAARLAHDSDVPADIRELLVGLDRDLAREVAGIRTGVALLGVRREALGVGKVVR